MSYRPISGYASTHLASRSPRRGFTSRFPHYATPPSLRFFSERVEKPFTDYLGRIAG
jgi:hypothetical protein